MPVHWALSICPALPSKEWNLDGMANICRFTSPMTGTSRNKQELDLDLECDLAEPDLSILPK